jgi:hypothetical protein
MTSFILNNPARPFSLWEKVPRGAGRMRGYDFSELTEIVTPHPPPPAAPSPTTGRGFVCSIDARKRWSRRARPRDIDRTANFFDHPVESLLHLVIGEAEFNEPMTFDGATARSIMFRLLDVMFAIKFNRQTKIVAAEVHDKARDRHLSAKFKPVQTAVAKLPPQHIFGRCAANTQVPRDLSETSAHIVKLERRGQRSQPLTRLLRSHPLPLGEGLFAQVNR